MSSLFEVYDPCVYYLMGWGLSWIILIFVFLFLMQFLFSGISGLGGLENYLKMFLYGEFKMVYKNKVMGVYMSGVLLGLFMFILIINLLGLIPYSFSCSSHLAFTLSLSLPIWVGLMILGWGSSNYNMFKHLIPVGTPIVLIPLMVAVETVGNLIRPIALAVRLMSNMIAGHLLLSLLGNCGLSLILGQLGFFFFEVFVCFIQAFVFCVLVSLYGSEL